MSEIGWVSRNIHFAFLGWLEAFLRIFYASRLYVLVNWKNFRGFYVQSSRMWGTRSPCALKHLCSGSRFEMCVSWVVVVRARMTTEGLPEVGGRGLWSCGAWHPVVTYFGLHRLALSRICPLIWGGSFIRCDRCMLFFIFFHGRLLNTYLIILFGFGTIQTNLSPLENFWCLTLLWPVCLFEMIQRSSEIAV